MKEMQTASLGRGEVPEGGKIALRARKMEEGRGKR